MEEFVGQSLTMRYRASDRDVFYGGGVVNGARGITLMGDLCERMMARLYKNAGKCTKVESIRLYTPIHAGDYLEDICRVIEHKADQVKIQCRLFKVCAIPENPQYPSSIDMFEEPVLVTEGTFVYQKR